MGDQAALRSAAEVEVWPVRRRGKLAQLQQRFREFRVIARSLISKNRPLLAQIVVMRRCNLSCSYCDEFDKISAPVPLATVLRRIDQLAELGTGIITISGGEPLLHPDLDAIITRIRERDMLAGVLTNGFFLTPERVERLNDAGLEYLQISIDKVWPDETTQKSLKSLERKLQYLAEHAQFHVNINTVVGPNLSNADDAFQIAARAKELGFSFSAGLLHDEDGQMLPLSSEQAALYTKLLSSSRQLYTRINRFQQNLINGGTNNWHCLAGARYLYICEQGLVHYCSRRRGTPAIPLERYTQRHIQQAWTAPKSCAPKCNVGCVHRACSVDNALRTFETARAVATSSPVFGQPLYPATRAAVRDDRTTR